MNAPHLVIGEGQKGATADALKDGATLPDARLGLGQIAQLTINFAEGEERRPDLPLILKRQRQGIGFLGMAPCVNQIVFGQSNIG